MRIEITQPGIFNAKGEAITVGTELTVKKEPTAWEGRYRVLADGKGNTPVNNDDKPKVYAVKEQSAGWHAVVDADGNAVTKNLRADAVAGFDALSDDDKAKFIADNPKAE